MTARFSRGTEPPWLAACGGPLPLHVVLRQAAQFLIDEGNQPLDGALVPFARIREEARDIAVFHHVLKKYTPVWPF